jgi:hypothetical protein
MLTEIMLAILLATGASSDALTVSFTPPATDSVTPRKPIKQTWKQKKALIRDALKFAEGYWYARGHVVTVQEKNIRFTKNIGYAICTYDPKTGIVELSDWYSWTNDLSFWPYGCINGVQEWPWMRVCLKYILTHAIGHSFGIQNSEMPVELREVEVEPKK